MPSVGMTEVLHQEINELPTQGASKNLIHEYKKHTPASMLKAGENEEEKRYQTWKKNQQKAFLEHYDNRRISHFIPILYLPYQQGSSKLMIYFHANAEDIVLSHELLDFIRVLLKVNVVAVEYPGYGLYTEKM